MTVSQDVLTAAGIVAKQVYTDTLVRTNGDSYIAASCADEARRTYISTHRGY